MKKYKLLKTVGLTLGICFLSAVFLLSEVDLKSIHFSTTEVTSKLTASVAYASESTSSFSKEFSKTWKSFVGLIFNKDKEEVIITTDEINKVESSPTQTQIINVESIVQAGPKGEQGSVGSIGATGLRGPKGEKGDSGAGVDTSLFVLKSFLGGQVDRIFDVVSDGVSDLRNSISERVDTALLAVSGNATVGGDMTVTGNIIGNVVGAITSSFLKITSGSLLSTPQDGAIEYDGNHYYSTIGSSRYQLDQQSKLGLNASKGLIVGDSTIASYSGQSSVDTFLLTSSDTLAGTTITNQAANAHTILQQQAVWVADANKATYDWIIVEIGLNDLNPAESASVALDRYQTLIDTINSGKKTGAIIIVSTMTPNRQYLIDTWGSTNGAIAYQKWLDMNTAIMGGGADAITGVDYRVNDHTLAMDDGAGNMAVSYDVGDDLHELNSGRAIIASAWRSVLNTAGFLTATTSTIYDKSFGNNGASTSLTTPRLGIGTRSPYTVLELMGDGTEISTGSPIRYNFLSRQTGTSNRGIWLGHNASEMIGYVGSSGANSSLAFVTHNGTAWTEKVRINNVGNVGIGITDPSAQKLVVAGNIRVGTGTTGCVEDADGTLLTGTCSSDERLKKNINPLQDVLERLVKIIPVTYNWRSDEFPERYWGDSLETGIIAQDVEEQFPELVVTDDNGFKQITFQYLQFYILQGIRELNSKVENLLSLDTSSENSLGSLVKNLLGNIENNITNLYASVIHADKVETDMLCVGGTCVTEEQFLEMVNKNATTSSPSLSPEPEPDMPTCDSPQILVDGVCADPEPEPAPEPEPDPTITP